MMAIRFRLYSRASWKVRSCGFPNRQSLPGGSVRIVRGIDGRSPAVRHLRRSQHQDAVRGRQRDRRACPAGVPQQPAARAGTDLGDAGDERATRASHLPRRVRHRYAHRAPRRSPVEFTIEDLQSYRVESSISRRRAEEDAFDCAIQKHVYKTCGVLVGGTHLMRQNSDNVCRGGIANAQLFARSDCGAAVATMRQDLPSLIEEAWRWINIKSPPKGSCPCAGLSRGNHCEMFAHINSGHPGQLRA